MKRWLVAAAVAGIVLLVTPRMYAQRWSLGGTMGLSVIDGTPGFQLTPTFELLVSRNIGIGTEFSVNTQYPSPILWYPYVKYYFAIHGSEWRPFASAGPLLALRVPNGPCFGFLVDGGVNIPVAPGLYLAPSVLVGPVFGYGGGGYPMLLHAYFWGIPTWGLIPGTIRSETVLAFSVRAGIRYEM
jgi:peptidoglycan hydrolase-like protein with peptidoglycan-binding domain